MQAEQPSSEQRLLAKFVGRELCMATAAIAQELGMPLPQAGALIRKLEQRGALRRCHSRGPRQRVRWLYWTSGVQPPLWYERQPSARKAHREAIERARREEARHAG